MRQKIAGKRTFSSSVLVHEKFLSSVSLLLQCKADISGGFCSSLSSLGTRPFAMEMGTFDRILK